MFAGLRARFMNESLITLEFYNVFAGWRAWSWT